MDNNQDEKRSTECDQSRLQYRDGNSRESRCLAHTPHVVCEVLEEVMI